MRLIPAVNIESSTHSLSDSGVNYSAYNLSRKALLVSSSHPQDESGRYTSGGSFLVIKDKYVTEKSPSVYNYANKATDVLWKSCFVPSSSIKTLTSGSVSATFPALPVTSTVQNTTQSYGATGWRRSRPGNPVASAFNFAAELRDLPTLPLKMLYKLKNFRSLGSEYLNITFGWLPFVSDIKKMYELHRTLNSKLNQLMVDNGKGIRRRRSLGDTSTSTAGVKTSSGAPGVGCFPTPANNWLSGNSSSQIVTTDSEKIWFVGRFRYYVPDIGSDQWTKKATAALYGANPTPEAIYNAIPWTWLIDWFSNIGDAVSNASSNAVGNETADYCYVMRENSHSEVQTCLGSGVGRTRQGPGALNRYVEDLRYSISATYERTIKSRVAGSPYGFGVSFGGLSAYQGGVLAALGISRSRF